MHDTGSDWQRRLDMWIAVLASALPICIVLGNVAFEFSVSVTGLLWIFRTLRWPGRMRGDLPAHPLFLPLVCWFAVVLASRLINGFSAHEILHDIAFLRHPLFVIALLDVSGRLPLHRYLLTGLTAGIGYAALNMLSAHLLGYDLIGNPLARYTGKLKEGARIGALAAYAGPFVLMRGLFEERLEGRQKMFLIAFGMIGIALLALTRVRTALLAGVFGLVGGLLWVLFRRRRMTARSIVALTALGAGGLLLVYWINPSLSSFYDRIYYWKVSWQLWLQNPIIGVGISSFKEAYRHVAESGVVTAFIAPDGTAFSEVDPHHAHNLFLQLLTCTGLSGFLVFAWLFIQAVRIIGRNSDIWQVGATSWPFIFLAIGLTGWNVFDAFNTALLVFFLAIIGTAAAGGASSKLPNRPALSTVQAGRPVAEHINVHRRKFKMAISKELLDILVCPKCKGDLILNAEEDGLICNQCKLIYEIRDDIPIMLIEEAKPLPAQS